MTSAAKTIILTGASRGLGRAIALALAAAGHPLALVCRDVAGGEAAQDAVHATPNNAGATLVLADLMDPAQIRAAATQLGALGPLGAIIHNAGLWPTALALDARGVERSFAVNQLAPFHLNALLWPRLRESGARIVHVSAGLYALGRRELDAVAHGRSFSSLRTYCDTKRSNAVTTVALARRVQGSGVTVNAVHPGVLRTGLGEGDGHWATALIRPLKALWRSPESGADGPCWLATDAAVAGINGAFFDERRQVAWRSGVQDEAEGEALWALSERLCGVRWGG